MGEWQHSHRRHGYWQGTDRLAYIGLSHPRVKPTLYHWYIDATGKEGTATSLQQARKAVMKELQTNK